ncbi:MAG: hypothetical protein KF724_07170 [Phycisphaeraceae bacterium]|nr:hypothetical protein [Phycisphaeraceae bacterium]
MSFSILGGVSLSGAVAPAVVAASLTACLLGAPPASGLPLFSPPARQEMSLVPSALQQADPDEPAPALMGPPRPGAEVDPDLQFLRSILQNPANSPEVRQGAALRIVTRGSADARRIIDEALRSGDTGQIDAVATAMDDEARRPSAMLEALLVALGSAPRELHPKVTRLLAREGDAASERVAALALDPARPTSERLAYIFAMGQLRGRDQLPDLIALLDERRREPAEVIREACEALDRITGQRLGNNAESWRQWWAARRAAPTPEFMVVSLQDQLAQLHKQLELENERGTKLVGKLRQAYLDFLVTMPVPERSERIVLLLDDEMPEVRNIGLSQVERMLRNGERPPETLVTKVLERVTDRVPAIRARAVRVIGDLGALRASERIAELLPAEGDSATAEAMLRQLGVRPSEAAFGPATARLADPMLAEVAAFAVNRVADAGLTPPGWELLVIEPARRAMQQKPTPEILRLVAAAGGDADRDLVEEFLASDDEILRVGAAEGMRRAGRRRALMERAEVDAGIYPVAVAAVADQPPSSVVVAMLVDMPPKPDQVETWNAALARVLEGLSPSDLLAVDETIAPLPFVTARARTSGLRAAVNASGAIEASTRHELMGRLADLLMAEGDSRAALRLLTDERQQEAPSLRPRLFRAAAMEGEYELAAGIEPTAAPWLTLLESLVPRAPRQARPLADEINLRFGRSLSDAERDRLATAERSLARVGES